MAPDAQPDTPSPANVSLRFRSPAFPWIVTGLIGALALHALVWFLTRAFALAWPEALQETLRQALLAVFWMVCPIALWSMQLPKSRLSALLHIMTCAFVVCLLGSAVAFVNWMVSENIGFHTDNLLPFSAYALLMMLGQLSLAMPSAALLQQVLLTPARGKRP